MASDLGIPWAMLGLIGGFWKIALVAAVAVALYGKSGLPRHPLVRLLLPVSRTARARSRAAAPGKPARWSRTSVVAWALALAALAAWIATKMILPEPGGPTP